MLFLELPFQLVSLILNESSQALDFTEETFQISTNSCVMSTMRNVYFYILLFTGISQNSSKKTRGCLINKGSFLGATNRFIFYSQMCCESNKPVVKVKRELIKHLIAMINLKWTHYHYAGAVRFSSFVVLPLMSVTIQRFLSNLPWPADSTAQEQKV